MRRDHAEHKRRIAAALRAANSGRHRGASEPAFHVVLATDHWGNGCTLRWDSHTPTRQVLARYACFPATPRHDGGPLLPPSVPVPVDLVADILNAFRSREVRDETIHQLEAVLNAA